MILVSPQFAFHCYPLCCETLWVSFLTAPRVDSFRARFLRALSHYFCLKQGEIQLSGQYCPIETKIDQGLIVGVLIHAAHDLTMAGVRVDWAIEWIGANTSLDGEAQ